MIASVVWKPAWQPMVRKIPPETAWAPVSSEVERRSPFAICARVLS